MLSGKYAESGNRNDYFSEVSKVKPKKRLECRQLVEKKKEFLVEGKCRN
jgi:hypothetical protein